MTDGEVQQKKPSRQRSSRRQFKRSLVKLKRFSQRKIPQLFIKPFTGPKPLYRRPLFWLGLGIGGSAIAGGVVWWSIEQTLPKSTKEVLTYVRPGTLTLKAADGAIIYQSGAATREQLKIWQIPEPLIHAFIATEDRRFYQHEGVDYQGVLRAVVSNFQARGVVEGGSTLTQQLARIVFLDQQRSIWRKLKEVRVAQKIEQQLDKNQILERYLNLVYLGEGAYGIADASWVYFSKPVDQLTLPEMAMLAGIPPAPNEYSPFVNQKAALQRRNIVLQNMQDAGYITAKEAKEAIASPLTTKRSNPKRLDREAAYFTEYIQKELPKYVSAKDLQSGLTVETTLNLEWQKIAEQTIKDTITENGRGSHFKQAAMVTVDPRNGQIKAMVGGKDFFNNQFNRVTQAQRQPGSTFKAFVYTTAIAAGFTPYRGYLDSPYVVDGYKPKNFSEKYLGWLSMRDALINSVNIVAVKVLVEVGWEPTINLAHKMGIESELKPIYSLALGGSEVNLLELTSAYGTFATQGLHIKPHGIRRIFNRQGKLIYQEQFKPERALDEETSAIMTWMLRAVVNEGTGRSAQLDRPVAGKTGTSDEARDLWFIGYIPQLVTGVWLGNDDNEPTWGASSTAAYTWHEFMYKAVKGMRTEQFPPRPDALEDRKPQIKAQPIRPRNIYSGPIESTKDKDDENSAPRGRRYREADANDDSPRPRQRSRQRRRVQANDEEEGQPRNYRRNVDREDSGSERPAPRRRSTRSREQSEASAPRQRSARRQSAPVETGDAPQSQEAPLIRPPAPYAAKKESSSGE